MSRLNFIYIAVLYFLLFLSSVQSLLPQTLNIPIADTVNSDSYLSCYLKGFQKILNIPVHSFREHPHQFIGGGIGYSIVKKLSQMGRGNTRMVALPFWNQSTLGIHLVWQKIY
ncbi:MAG: hypothetical protein D6748_09860 [Calditrichaeota bacterium]|nr:MAG: hypothetical protein D6748_09860 [Calditrichota bacterium]